METTLVLLPGLTDDTSMWDHQIEQLTDVAQPVAIDLLEQRTVHEGAVRVLDSVAGKIALAGFSMGGYVALEIMRLAPERVDRLALVDTSARADTEERTRDRRRRMARAEKGDYENVIEELVPHVVHASRLGDDELLGTIKSMALRIGPDAYVRQEETCMTRPDSLNDLHKVSCPTMVICGRQDTITPPELSLELAAGIVGAKVAWVDECNHYTPMERPFATSTLLRLWLSYD